MSTSVRQERASEADGASVDAQRRRSRLPAGLGALLLVTFIITTTWAVVTPPWQTPDEPSHFAYVQTIAENGRLPGGEGMAVSTEVSEGIAAANTDQVIFNFRGQPPFDNSFRDDFTASTTREERRDGGGPGSTSTYPPLYYLLETIPYLAFKSADIYTRLTAMRIFSGLFVLLTVLGAWLLIGELLGRNRLAQFTGAATVALWPMMGFISTGINVDALEIALWTLTAWLGVRALKRGLTLGNALAIGLVVGGALVTKTASLVLVPIVGLALLVAAWRGRQVTGTGRSLAAIVLAVAVMVAPLAAYTVKTRASDQPAFSQATEIQTASSDGFKPREFASYLWQYYLPQLSFMQPRIEQQYRVISSKPVLNLWLGTGTGVFGWVNVWFPKWVYWTVGAALVLMAMLFAAASARWWRRSERGSRVRRLLPAAFLAGIGVLTIGALHYADYGFYAAGKGYFMQGRYLLPLAALLAAGVGFAVAGLPRRVRPWVAAGWIGAVLVFQLASLGLVLERFYA